MRSGRALLPALRLDTPAAARTAHVQCSPRSPVACSAPQSRALRVAGAGRSPSHAPHAPPPRPAPPPFAAAATDAALADAVDAYLGLNAEEQASWWERMHHERTAGVGREGEAGREGGAAGEAEEGAGTAAGWSRHVHALAQRIATSSPRSLEWFASVRGLCSSVEAGSARAASAPASASAPSPGHPRWPRVVDAAVASAARPLYGAAFVQLHQLSLQSPSSPRPETQQHQHQHQQPSGQVLGVQEQEEGGGGGLLPAASAASPPPLSPSVHAALLAQVRAGETVHKTDSDGGFAFKFGRRRSVHALVHACDRGRLLAVLYSSFLQGGAPASMAEIDGETGGAEQGSPAGMWDPASRGPAGVAWGGGGRREGGGRGGGGGEDVGATPPLPSPSPSPPTPTPTPTPPPTTAVFYSVSSHASAARGLRLGTAIIYRAAGAIASANPGLRNFVTLSPIPDFLPWLSRQLAAASPSAFPPPSPSPSSGARRSALPGSSADRLEAILAGAGVTRDALLAAAAASGLGAERADVGVSRHGGGAGTAAFPALECLVGLLMEGDGRWWKEGRAELRAAVCAATAPLVRAYLLAPSQSPFPSSSAGGSSSSPGPLCRVAAFHLGNGARMARICAGADPSPAGLARSAGFNVNYLYSGGVGAGRVDGQPPLLLSMEGGAAGGGRRGVEGGGGRGGHSAGAWDAGRGEGAAGLEWAMREGAAAYAADPAGVLGRQDPELVWAASVLDRGAA